MWLLTEQYLQSIEDFTSSLDLLKASVQDIKTDRSIAEIHYHIGVACVYASQYDNGIAHFKDALAILEAKNASLQAVVAAAEQNKESSEESTEVTEARAEMKDIAELVPEIKLKVSVCVFKCFGCYVIAVVAPYHKLELVSIEIIFID